MLAGTLLPLTLSKTYSPTGSLISATFASGLHADRSSGLSVTSTSASGTQQICPFSLTLTIIPRSTSSSASSSTSILCPSRKGDLAAPGEKSASSSSSSWNIALLRSLSTFAAIYPSPSASSVVESYFSQLILI